MWKWYIRSPQMQTVTRNSELSFSCLPPRSAAGWTRSALKFSLRKLWQILNEQMCHFQIKTFRVWRDLVMGKTCFKNNAQAAGSVFDVQAHLMCTHRERIISKCSSSISEESYHLGKHSRPQASQRIMLILVRHRYKFEIFNSTKKFVKFR